MAIKRITEADIQKIIADAREQVDREIFYEPRAHWDFIAVGPPPGGTEVPKRSGDNTFRNGEQFPHHITDVTFSTTAAEGLRQLQRIGVRFQQHDVHYISRDPAPIPVWQTRPTALPAYIDPATSLWRFAHPNVLSARDTLKVSVRGVGLAGTVTVAFHGLGVLSRRPYLFSASLAIATSDFAVHDLDGRRFRNDSSEPIALYDMVVTVTNTAHDIDTRRFFVQVKQIGNGTGSNWFDASVGGSSELSTPGAQFGQTSQMPAVLLSVDGGLAVSHRLPAEGWVWLPGDGLFCEVQDQGLPTFAALYVATLGYVVVK